MNIGKYAAPLMFGILTLSACANGSSIQRQVNSDFPISTSVVTSSQHTIYLSGVLTRPEPGDTTELQAERVLQTIRENLTQSGSSMSSVLQMRVYLVGEDRLDGKLDFDGFNRAYKRFFEEADYPARTVVQVAALPVPGSLVEIDLIANK